MTYRERKKKVRLTLPPLSLASCLGGPQRSAGHPRGHPRSTTAGAMTTDEFFRLDKFICRLDPGTVLDVAVIEEPAAAEASLDPIRARILAALAEPGSAAMLAARLGLARQKANYHLKELERHGLVELAEERRKGNVTERVYRATAASYVISPSCPGRRQPGPLPVSRPALRPLAAGAGVPAGAGGRDPADRRRPGPAAGRHVRHRRGGAVRLGGRTGGLRRGTGPGRGGPRRALPRRVRPGGPEPPAWSSGSTRSPRRSRPHPTAGQED